MPLPGSHGRGPRRSGQHLRRTARPATVGADADPRAGHDPAAVVLPVETYR